ncbi:hypothetical protein BKA82DRAFT_28875 [Pisolithus tinctorius]|uniref:Zn(2)-C6 fungal-type domain-containing protein n=1 Tax=Pisolithus tinctorius Marx 270 TaxID=870435 RepID=A0A0C3IX19_PISTI|nr:hypothetical protein BKA82DRAFT_28875 [Pisolithus tinctorius]KIO01338.1 hypothetical protein M404DRAFT_28875 [Pisolithus tinctorius Marx 270]
MSLSLSHKLFKKLPELDAAANRILQIYFKDIMESSKLGKADKIVKWRGAIKAINDELDSVHDLIARTDEIPMTLIGVDMFLKWHEDLGLIDHLWPEWKTTLAPSKTDVANHKWLDIVERRYNYHQLGLPMPHVVPTPAPPTQETEMPMSNKGKRKATEVEVEQMIAEGSHRMEVDDEGEEEVPEKEDEEEEPVRGRQKRQAAVKMTTHRSRHRSCSMKATAETDDEDNVSAQGQSKCQPCPLLDRLYSRTALAFRRTPSPDPKSCELCRRHKVQCYRNPRKSCFPCDGHKIRCSHAKGGTTAPTRQNPSRARRKKRARSLSLTMEAQEPQSPAEHPQKQHVSMASKAIDTGVGPSNQGKMIPEGSSLKIRIPAFKHMDSHPIPATESTVAETHPSTTVAPVQPTTAATPSAPSPICAPIANVSQMSNTIKQQIEDLERRLRDAEAHRQYYKDQIYDFQIQQDETTQTLDRMAHELEALRIWVYGRPLGDDLIDLFGPLADETRVDRTAG